MTTTIRCSILSILRLERSRYQADTGRTVKSNLHLCLRRQDLGTYSSEDLIPNAVYAGPSKKSNAMLPYLLGALALLLLYLIVKSTFPYPLHASCTVKWDFADSCVYVIQRLRSQLIKWSNYDYCGDKCFYQLQETKAYENDTIAARHLSLKDKIVDELTMSLFAPSNRSCIVVAESKAKSWFSVFDDGRNYCNLRDLIAGMEYDNDMYFSEFTSNIICTQYDMAYCQ